jgi:hypothetical protein
VFGEELTLCSAMSGIVTDGGEPVAGAHVERRYLWHLKDQTGTDRTTTDAAGRFSLPAVTAKTFHGGLMPHQPLIEQTVSIRHDGRDYLAWELAKNTHEPKRRARRHRAGPGLRARQRPRLSARQRPLQARLPRHLPVAAGLRPIRPPLRHQAVA